MNEPLKIFILGILAYLLMFHFNDICLDPIIGIGFLITCLFIFLPRILTANQRNKNVQLRNWQVIRLNVPDSLIKILGAVITFSIGINGLIAPHFINTGIAPDYSIFQTSKFIYHQELTQNYLYIGLIILAFGFIWENIQSKYGVLKFKDDTLQLEWKDKVIDQINLVSEFDQIEIQASNIILIRKQQSHSQIIMVSNLMLDDQKIEELKNWLDKKLGNRSIN